MNTIDIELVLLQKQIYTIKLWKKNEYEIISIGRWCTFFISFFLNLIILLLDEHMCVYLLSNILVADDLPLSLFLLQLSVCVPASNRLTCICAQSANETVYRHCANIQSITIIASILLSFFLYQCVCTVYTNQWWWWWWCLYANVSHEPIRNANTQNRKKHGCLIVCTAVLRFSPFFSFKKKEERKKTCLLFWVKSKFAHLNHSI